MTADLAPRTEMSIATDAQIEPRPLGLSNGIKLITILTSCYNEVLNVRTLVLNRPLVTEKERINW
jgi:hypothetical protein